MDIINVRKVILDSSALISLLKQEKGCEFIEQYVGKSVMSSINLAETSKYLVDNHKQDIKEVRKILSSLLEDVIIVDEEIAYLSSEIISFTKEYGLSLGDRVCIATGIIKQYPIITTDRIWGKLKIPNVNIVMARE